MKIAVIDKAPNNNRYNTYFKFDFDLYHLSSVAVPKLLKKDIDLEFNDSMYDLVVLVGAEASKEFAKVTSVTNMAGQLINNKFICISNPAMLHFKPEGKPEFQRCIDKIHGYINGTIGNSSTTGDFKGIQTIEEAREFLLEVLANAEGYVSLDTETTALYPRDGYVLGVSISYKLKHGRYISCDAFDDENTALLQRIIDTFIIIFHNMKFDYKMLGYHLSLKFNRDRVHDTMLMHYVLNENDSHGLKPLALKYTDYGDYDSELEEFKTQYCKDHKIKKEDFTYDLIPFEILQKYASIDTAVTLEIFFKFWSKIQENKKLLSVYNTILIPGTLFIMDMEEEGIPIDKERMVLSEDYLNRWIDEAREVVYSFEEVRQFEKDQGDVFNPNSVIQLRKVLFDYVKLKPTGKKTGTGAISTDAEVLGILSEQHDLPKAILNVRQLSKIKNTYISKILPELDRDSRIRTNFNLIFTTSGRLSSSGKFNAQQIPRDNPIIKGCIKAPEGYKIVSQDLKTGEVYVAALLSGDKKLQEVFKTGGDFHSTIAKMVFNLDCPVEDVKRLYPLDRQSAKAVTFGIMYGSGPAKVADTVNKEGGNLSIQDAKEIIEQYFTTFYQLKHWLKTSQDQIKQNGFIYSVLGRKRRLVNVFSDDKGIAAHEVRSGVNFLIQSVCSDINLLGAIDTANELKEKNLDAKIFALVHDSIVAIVKDECVEEYREIVGRNTQKDRGLSINGFPIGIDQEIGQDYSFSKFEKYYELVNGKLEKIDAEAKATLTEHILEESTEDLGEPV